MTQSSGPSSEPSPSIGEANKEQVNHPVHYTSHPSGIECIQITEHYNFNIGNVIKYVWRAGLKNDELEDLRKARWYLDREIARRTAGSQPEIGCPVTEPMLKEKRAEVSDGSEPVAWAVPYRADEPPLLISDYDRARTVARRCGCGLPRPLYRHQHPVVAETATTTLTDAERQAIEAILVDPDSAPANSAAILRGLLERAGGER